MHSCSCLHIVWDTASKKVAADADDDPRDPRLRVAKAKRTTKAGRREDIIQCSRLTDPRMLHETLHSLVSVRNDRHRPHRRHRVQPAPRRGRQVCPADSQSMTCMTQLGSVMLSRRYDVEKAASRTQSPSISPLEPLSPETAAALTAMDDDASWQPLLSFDLFPC